MSYALTVLASHPVQYQAPFFRRLADVDGLDLRVLYMWEDGMDAKYEPGFDQEVDWDRPLLEGYDWEALDNWAPRGGPGSFLGLSNPGVVSRLLPGNPDGVLVEGWSNLTNWLAVASGRLGGVDLLFRGETVARTERDASRARRALLGRFLSSFDAVLPIAPRARSSTISTGFPESAGS